MFVIIPYLTISIIYKLNGTTQGPHMSCSYSKIATEFFDVKAENYIFKPTIICDSDEKSQERS